MKSFIRSGLLVLIVSILLPTLAFANSPSDSDDAAKDLGPKKLYEVKYPTFKIMVNNSYMDNAKSKYPVLIYEGVTYFPMTWGVTQALGLDVGWDAEKGFAINKTNLPAAKLYNESAIISARHLYAKLPDFPIRVNDNIIDNDKEEYPVLVFNDVTYFPMTWRFAVEELGLNISMDNNKFNISKGSN